MSIDPPAPRPVGWSLNLWALALFLLWLAVTILCPLGFLFGFCLGLPLLVLGVVILSLWAWRASTPGLNRPAAGGGRLRWVPVPVLGLTLLGLLLTQAPQRLGFLCHQAALQRLAERAGRPPPEGIWGQFEPRWVGLYRVARVHLRNEPAIQGTRTTVLELSPKLLTLVAPAFLYAPHREVSEG